MLLRERVVRSIANRAAFPVVVLAAKAGSGKSVALAQYLETLVAPFVRFDVRKSHGSLTRFVRGFAAVLASTVPGVAQSLAIAHERAIRSQSPAEILAAWVAEHLESSERLIVIDDYHHCDGDAAIARFLASAIAKTRGSTRWIVATRSSADLPIATWLAHRDADVPLDESILCLSAAEARVIAADLAPDLDDALVARIAAQTGGAPSAFAFGLCALGARPIAADRVLAGGGDPFDAFVEETMQGLAPCERDLVIETSVFPEIDATLFEAAGYAEAANLLERIEAAAPHLFTVRDGVAHYHQLFVETSLRRLSERGSDAFRTANLRAAFALECADRISEALVYRMHERDFPGVVNIIEAHGFAFLESGCGESMHEAIAALDPFVQMGNSVVLAIKAIAESRSGRFDTAECWFQLAIDRTSNASLRGQIGFQYCTHLLRFFRPEAIERLEALVADPATSADLQAYARASLGPAYVFRKRFDEAIASVDSALVFASGSSNDHLYAKAHHQASYVALYLGDATRAKTLATISLERSSERGFFDVAASALSVLYNVAADIDDDPSESARLLDAMGDCAAKSGSLTDHLMALVASLEIEVERGGEDEAARIDAKIKALDTTCSGRLVYEVLLPTQAMRASWRGDFAGAYRLLASSAEDQWSSDRKALRYGEIAFYAAAAGLADETAGASRVALEILERIDVVELRVQRARIFVALALTISGRGELAARMLAIVDKSPEAISSRLRSLRDFAVALDERYRGRGNAAAFLASMRELESSCFGGVMRTFMLLPLGDNAIRRIESLTRDERVTILTWADANDAMVDPRIGEIARKLACDRSAIRRAVVRYRSSFEYPPYRFHLLEEAI
jgi:ATP/maltotriose-dependent transcriptional regulator MalT